MSERNEPRVTSFVSHEACSRHDTGWRHPEHQGRLPAVVRAIYKDMAALHAHLREVEARPATEGDLLRVHGESHLAAVRAAVERAAEVGSPVSLEGDTMVSAASWEAALAAAGTAITGVDEVLTGEAPAAFCCARPPGRGVGLQGAADFCLFNNVAVAACHAREEHGLRRLLIVDWGARPEPATVTIFESDADVRVLTVRPALASVSDDGDRDDAVTRPTQGAAEGTFTAAFTEALEDALAHFTPELILLSAGFDALASDPTTDMPLAPNDYHALTRTLRDAADRCCDGRLVSVLEEGYDPKGMGDAVVHHLRALMGLPKV